MAIHDATKFLRQAANDKELRLSLYTLNKNEIFYELSKIGYSFNYEEFEESVNMLHVKCATEEQANLLLDIANWFKALLINEHRF